MMTTKKCSNCGEAKDLTLFSKDRARTSGIRPYCKACIREKAKRYYAANKEKCREQQKRYEATHKHVRKAWEQKEAVCECGMTVSNNSMKAHRHTKQHKIRLGLIPDDSNCPCGGKYSENNRLAHAKTKKHMKYTVSVGKACGACLLYEKDKPYGLTTCPDHRTSSQ